MPEDPIVAEVRRHRKEIAAEFNNDLDAVVAHLRKRERASGHKLVQPPKRKAVRGRRRAASSARVTG